MLRWGTAPRCGRRGTTLMKIKDEIVRRCEMRSREVT